MSSSRGPKSQPSISVGNEREPQGSVVDTVTMTISRHHHHSLTMRRRRGFAPSPSNHHPGRPRPPPPPGAPGPAHSQDYPSNHETIGPYYITGPSRVQPQPSRLHRRRRQQIRTRASRLTGEPSAATGPANASTTKGASRQTGLCRRFPGATRPHRRPRLSVAPCADLAGVLGSPRFTRWSIFSATMRWSSDEFSPWPGARPSLRSRSTPSQLLLALWLVRVGRRLGIGSVDAHHFPPVAPGHLGQRRLASCSTFTNSA